MSKASLEAEIDQAIERGYLVHRSHGQWAAYARRTRELGVMALVLREYRVCADLFWDGDAVWDRARACAWEEMPHPFSDERVGDAVTAMLTPFFEQARPVRGRRTMLLPGGTVGGLYRFDRQDGHAIAEILAAWFRDHLPPPESLADFNARIYRAPLRKSSVRGDARLKSTLRTTDEVRIRRTMGVEETDDHKRD